MFNQAYSSLYSTEILVRMSVYSCNQYVSVQTDSLQSQYSLIRALLLVMCNDAHN